MVNEMTQVSTSCGDKNLAVILFLGGLNIWVQIELAIKKNM